MFNCDATTCVVLPTKQSDRGFLAGQGLENLGKVLGRELHRLASGAELQGAGLAQCSPEAREAGAAGFAVGVEGIAEGGAVDDDVEAILFGGVALAGEGGVGGDGAFVIVRAGDVQLVAVAVVDEVFLDALGVAGGPFGGAGKSGAGGQPAEERSQKQLLVHGDDPCIE